MHRPGKLQISDFLSRHQAPNIGPSPDGFPDPVENIEDIQDDLLAQANKLSECLEYKTVMNVRRSERRSEDAISLSDVREHTGTCEELQFLLISHLKYPIHALFDLMMQKEEDLQMDETERT